MKKQEEKVSNEEIQEEKSNKKQRRRKLPIFLEDHERIKILQQPNPRYITGQRNKLILNFIMDTGARLKETVDLKWNHINLMTNKLIIIEGKGKKDRITWFNDDLLQELIAWKERQAKDIGNCELVFTTTKGTKLTHRYVQQMVKRYANKAGIKKDITPHKLRHTFATDFYKETGDILKTMKALGHSDVSTTMIYTHIVDEEQEQATKNFRRNKINPTT